MLRKLTSLILIFCICSVTALAAVTSPTYGNMLVNGDLESCKGESLTGWKVASGTANVETKEIHGGKNAVHMTHTENMYMTQTVTPVPGETYTFSFWAKLAADNTNPKVQAAIKLEGFNTSRANNLNVTQAFDLKTRWEKFSFEAEMPDDILHLNVLVRLFNGGSILFDDISFEGKLPEGFSNSTEYTVKKEAAKIPADGIRESLDGKEYLANPSFEAGEASPEGWEVVGGEWTDNQWVVYDKSTACTGEKSVKITSDGSNYPWVCQLIPDLTPGATYQLTGWYNSNVSSNSIICKFEFYTENEIKAGYGLNSTTTLYYGGTKGAWQQITANFTMPEDGKAVAIYPRLMGASGTVFFDDMSLKLVENPSEGVLETDEVFYYADTKEGTARVSLRTNLLSEGSVTFTLRDASDAVFAKAENVPFALGENAVWRFPVQNMTLTEEYTLTADLYTKEGTLAETHSSYVYRYNRPGVIDENGIYRNADGSPFYPTIAYHAGSAFEELSKIGVNVVQGSNYGAEGYIKILDKANEYGMKILVTLYPNMKPAGAPENVENTKTIINAVKDHPATFAYAVQDEPFAHNPNCEDDLRESYKLIRSLDPDHPVYICECFEDCYAKSGKYVDVLCIDPYPFNASHVGTYVAEQTEVALAAVKNNKPVYVLESVLTFSGFRPEGYEIRTQNYQTLLAGGSAWGFYPYSPDNAQIDKILPESIFWKHMVSFHEKEDALLREYFYEEKHPRFNKGEGEGYKWESFVANGAVYVATYNTVRDTKTVEIPLESDNKKITLTNAALELIAGADKLNAKIEGNTLKVDMTETQALLYKITPSEPIDTILLSETRFTDTASYNWAADAIKTLEDRGTANGGTSFRPGEAITRGDFAMFLVETLDLYFSSESQFDDVKPDAEYAEALKKGRVYGILNGIGDNKYNPEATITRQDLMTIISRGLALFGEADLSAFTDAGQIADYALPHVSAMVKAGLVTGNADGTLNPLGNATRAEAAVIMMRILNR